MIRIHKISSMSILFVFSSKLVSSLIQVQTSQFIFRSGTKNPVRRHVHLHGNVSLRVGKSKNRRTHGKIVPSNSSTHSFGEKPPDPEMLTSSEYLNENVDKVSTEFSSNWLIYPILFFLSPPNESIFSSFCKWNTHIIRVVIQMVPGQEKCFMYNRCWNIHW